MSERIYRDPVHNIIRIRTDTDEGELMMRLIDAPEFQRLRRIKQLGLGLYTYQGAEHSRFTHSLGEESSRKKGRVGWERGIARCRTQRCSHIAIVRTAPLIGNCSELAAKNAWVFAFEAAINCGVGT